MVKKPTAPAKLPRLKSASLIIGDGEKGGVGKSFGVRAAVHSLVATGASLKGFDADARNAHLARYYSQSIDVSRVYLREQRGWNELIDSLAQVTEDCHAIVDLPANIGEVLAKEMPRLRQACQSLGRPIYRIWVIDGEFDSVAQLHASADITPFDCTIVVKNGLFGHEEDFELWNSSKLRRSLLDAGGLEIYLPSMPPGIRSQISSQRCSFTDAAQLRLTLSQKIDLEAWLGQTEANFAPLVELVGV